MFRALRAFIFGQGIERVMEKYREGIAEALGVPPSAIREGIVRRWYERWKKAFVKPETVYSISVIIHKEGGIHY